MSIQHTIMVGVTSGRDTDGVEFETASGSELIVDESIPDTDGGVLEVAFEAALDKLKSFVMMVTNEFTNHELAIALNDEKDIEAYPSHPLVWYEGCGVTATEFFGDDIEYLRVNNASGLTMRLRVWAIVDPT